MEMGEDDGAEKEEKEKEELPLQSREERDGRGGGSVTMRGRREG